MEQPLRIVVAKPGLDGHDRGAKVVARALRDAGHEVIYTGLRRTSQQIVDAVRDEDARFLGLSSLSGAHGHLFPQVCTKLVEAGLHDVIVLVEASFLTKIERRFMRWAFAPFSVPAHPHRKFWSSYNKRPLRTMQV
jgi:methylmalonyl-CoA mutase cobalamin-binding domain/chain